MAPPQLKCGSRDLQKYRCSSQVFKRDRISKSAECAETKAKPSQGKSSKSACTCSSASDDQSGYKTRPLESTRCLAKLFTSHPALFLDGPSDSRSNHLAEENTEVKLPDQHVSPSPPDSGSTRRLNMNDMPTEILQLIWGGVINTPACHTFKVKRGEVSEEGSRWSVHLWPATSRAELDTSAYQLWKHCLELNNIGFQMAFRRFVKEVQPIALRVPIASNSKYKAAKFYKTMAAIDKGQDLVILELDRGDSLPWFEHTLRKRGMDSRVIRDRMSDFRRVAIHYKYSHIDCRDGGAFACLCHGNNQPHEVYKACPLALASFLDLFPNLEQFYFVVDQKLVRHKKFAAAYRDKVAKTGFQVQIDNPAGPKARGKQFTIPRFFDARYEYLQQATTRFLRALDLVSPWEDVGDAHECAVETLQFYKSKKGNERFVQKLDKRAKVRFGLLISYPLEGKDKKVAK